MAGDASGVDLWSGGEAGPASLEDALEQAQLNLLRYQELFDFAPEGYLITDLKGVILQANYAAAAMLQTRKEFLVGKPLLFYVADGHRRMFALRLYQLSQEPGSREHWELSLRQRTGEPLYVLVSAAGESDDFSSGLRWTFRDITRRRQAEQALRAEKEFANGLIESAEVAVVVLGPGGQLTRANPFFCRLTGQSAGELACRRLTELLAPDDLVSFQKEYRQLVSSAHAHGIHRLRHRDGPLQTVAWSARPLIALADEHPPILFVASDITQLQEAQQRAVQAERLAAIGQMVAGLAHESRNALQRNQACLSVLALKLADRPAESELLARMQQAQDDLSQLYEDVREYAAPVQLDRCMCYPPQLWRQVWEDLAPLRAAKKATLVEEIGDQTWPCVADSFRLRQVFRNLLENALAASKEPACVLIRCQPGEIHGQAAIQVSICDNGPGFAPEQRAKAFEPFYTTKLRGTGLGLAICKRVIEAHGGRIEAGEGPGGQVIITLPRSQR